MRPMIPKALRLPSDLAEEVTHEREKRGVADADYYRLLIERGLLLEAWKWRCRHHPAGLLGLCEAVLETRNILRSLAAAREHGTIPKARSRPKTSSNG